MTAGTFEDVVVKLDRAKIKGLAQVKGVAADEATSIAERPVSTADVRIQSLQDPHGTGELLLLPVLNLDQLLCAEAVQVTLKRL